MDFHLGTQNVFRQTRDHRRHELTRKDAEDVVRAEADESKQRYDPTLRIVQSREQRMHTIEPGDVVR
jgi:hypothetical protein